MNKNLKIIIIATVTLFVIGSGVATYFILFNKDQGTEADEQTAEQQENGDAEKELYERESVIFNNPYYHNLEVIELNDGTYKMFFSENSVIKSASSTDGLSFELDDGSIMQGGMVAFVKIDKTTWRMYYVPSAGAGIKSATTPDGINFTAEAGYRISAGPAGSLDVGGPIHPSVIKLPDNTYKMFYDGVSSTNPVDSGPGYWTVMSATSEDGLTWAKDDGARISLEDCSNFFDEEEQDDEIDEDENISKDYCINGAWSVHADYQEKKYALYFSAGVYPIDMGGIWKAVSEDGINFTIEGPMLTQDPDLKGEVIESEIGGPEGVPQDPFILEVQEGKRLFYWTPDKGLQSALWKF